MGGYQIIDLQGISLSTEGTTSVVLNGIYEKIERTYNSKPILLHNFSFEDNTSNEVYNHDMFIKLGKLGDDYMIYLTFETYLTISNDDTITIIHIA